MRKICHNEFLIKMNFCNLWKYVALSWIGIITSDSSFTSESPSLRFDGKNSMYIAPTDAKSVSNSTSVNLTTAVTPTHTPKEIIMSGNLTLTGNTTAPEPDNVQSMSSTIVATSSMKTAMHEINTTLQSSFNDSVRTTAQPSTFYSSTSGQKIEASTGSTTINDTVFTGVLDTNSSSTETYPLSPAILAVIAVVATVLFFVIMYAIFKLVQSFSAVRFRRLHEMPMDDFDDYSGVYVEHTVPFRA